MREQTHLEVMEHNKIVGQKPARDAESYNIKTTTVMTQPPRYSLCKFSKHNTNPCLQKAPAKGCY
jgi:hypothetical protein